MMAFAPTGTERTATIEITNATNFDGLMIACFLDAGASLVNVNETNRWRKNPGRKTLTPRATRPGVKTMSLIFAVEGWSN
jgi:hypothetical protein